MGISNGSMANTAAPAGAGEGPHLVLTPAKRSVRPSAHCEWCSRQRSAVCAHWCSRQRSAVCEHWSSRQRSAVCAHPPIVNAIRALPTDSPACYSWRGSATAARRAHTQKQHVRL
jgi:hypothetical protein